MQSIQIGQNFDLAKVKPLEGLLQYREYCIQSTKRALAGGSWARKASPISNEPLEPWATIEGLEYGRCPQTGSLFLTSLPFAADWAQLLATISQYRFSKAFHADIKQSRVKNVYEPKKIWIEDTLRMHGFQGPHVLEVATPPSELFHLLKSSDFFGEVLVGDEMRLSAGQEKIKNFDAAVLLESLDRVDQPGNLLKNLSSSLKKGGLIFVTALVASGFDAVVLGQKNVYLHPPDRANFFSMDGLQQLLLSNGFELLEVSTPGILDVEIVKSHWMQKRTPPLSEFERRLLESEPSLQAMFQDFLQRSCLSSFARMVGRKRA